MSEKPSTFNPSRILPIGAAIVGLWLIYALISGSFYTVNQNEVAGVTRFGHLISAQPVMSGFHFKLPFADVAHKIRVSVERISIPEVRAKTVDNQFVNVDLSLSYRTADPFKALFQVGDMGSGGVIDKVIPFAQSRVLDAFGKVNALEITNRKTQIESELLVAIQAQAIELFGERVEDVQITKIGYDPTFEKNIQLTVQTRNQQLAAQNILLVKETEAKQAVAVAKGQADAAAANAAGERRVAIARAEGEAQKVRLAADAGAYDIQKRSEAEANAKKIIGTAEADVIATKVHAAGNAADYAAIIRADATKNWNGSVPHIQLESEKGGGQPILVLPQQIEK
jgi:membrane protease subunit HflC